MNPTNNNTITADSLNPVASTAGLPTQQFDNASTSGVTDSVASSISGQFDALNAQVTAGQQNLESSQTDITSLMNSLTGITADTQAAERASGVDTANTNQNAALTQLANLNAQAQSLNREAQAIPLLTEENVVKGNRTVTTRGMASLNNKKLRENALRALSIGQQSDIAMANLTGSRVALQAAQDKAQKIVDLKYEPMEAALKIKQQQYDFIKDNLTAAEKKRGEALQIKLTKEAAELAEKKQGEKDIEKMLINATSQDVPKDVLAEAQRFAKNGDKLGVAQALGVYTGDKLARDIQLSNLLTDKAQRANIYSTISQRNRDTSAGISEKVLTKVQSSSEYKTISGILPAIKAIKDYRDSVEKYGSFESFSGKGKGEKRATYGNAISAWKTLAGLGALSGADFGLAENVIPAGGKLFARNSTQLAQLDAALLNAVGQAEMLTTRMSQINPSASGLLQQQLSDIKTVGGLMVSNDPLNLGVKNTEGSNPLGI